MKTGTTAASDISATEAGRPLAEWLQSCAVAVEQLASRSWRKATRPLSLVLLGIVLVLGGTIGWVWHLRALDRATTVLKESAKAGEAELVDGRFSEAAAHFNAAVAAADTLGQDDAGVRHVRQMARESTAASQLLSKSPYELLQEAVDTAQRTPASWPQNFRTSYHDSWIVLETAFRRKAADGSGDRFELDCPVVLGEQRLILSANLPILDALSVEVTTDSATKPVIFAAQLDRMELDPLREGVWLLVLRPESAFLWSNGANLQRLGFDTDAGTERVLAAQSQWLKGGP